jgi:hypothetical protein
MTSARPVFVYHVLHYISLGLQQAEANPITPSQATSPLLNPIMRLYGRDTTRDRLSLEDPHVPPLVR